MSGIIWLVAGALFTAVALGTLAIYSSATRQRQTIRNRLARHTLAVRPKEEAVAVASNLRREVSYSSISSVNTLMRKRGWGYNIALELLRAGLPLRTGEFIAIEFLVVMLGFSLGLLLGRSPIIGIFVALVALMLPRLYLSTKKNGRRRAFERQLPEAIDMIVRSLRSGYGVVQGLEAVARELPEPIGPEFRQMNEEMTLGIPIEDALGGINERIQIEELELLVTALIVQKQTGGSLAEALSNISFTIRERIRIRNEVRVITTAPRVSGYVIGVLPILTGILMAFINRDYVSLMLGTTIGKIALVGGGTMTIVGLFISSKLADIEV